MKGHISLILVFCLMLICLMPITVSASGTNPDMVNFHINNADNWSALKYLTTWKSFAAGNYKATVKFKLNSGEMPKLDIGNEYGVEAISSMTNYTKSYDSYNYTYSISFTFTEKWSGNLGFYIVNYGRVTDFIIADPQLYLLDSNGDKTGNNLINTFASDYYVTSRTGERWLKAGISSTTVTINDYNPATFEPVRVLGDYNEDGTVDIVDLVTYKKAVANSIAINLTNTTHTVKITANGTNPYVTIAAVVVGK